MCSSDLYALAEGEGAPSGLTEQQQTGRAELLELYTELTDLPHSLAPRGEAPAPYEPTAVAALARPWVAPEGDPFLDPLADQPAIAWPGPPLPGEPVGPDVGCVVATGEQVTAVRAAASRANALTPWAGDDGARWYVTFRPLLPGETGCADLAD